MEIEKAIVGPLATNCYIVSEKNEAIVIDPGAEPEKIFSLLSSPLSLIIATHAHPDHIGAIWALKNEFPQAKFLLHQADMPLLKKFLPSLKPDGFLKEGKFPLPTPHFPRRRHSLWRRTALLSVIHTPGHTPGGICLLGKGVLFTGDTLFAQGVGRTDLPYSNQEDLIKSLKKLAKLPKDLIIYPGHGESSTLRRLQNQRFLRG
ncbi:MAG: MBL fold metallo-hydrolase [Patescibacteria group bacterium]